MASEARAIATRSVSYAQVRRCRCCRRSGRRRRTRRVGADFHGPRGGCPARRKLVPCAGHEQSADEDDPWSTFCAALARAGRQILRPDAPADPLTRAEGQRYLARLTRGALESCLEFADPEAPGFYSLSHETLKIGADNPDNFYQNASLDGRLEYRISGTRGTVHYLAFSTKAGGYGSTGGLAPTGFLDSTQLTIGADGALRPDSERDPACGQLAAR